MIRYEWTFTHSRKDVSAVALDPEYWPIAVRGFRPVFGTKFSSSLLPTLATDYVGRLQCVVTKVVERRLVALHIRADRRTLPPTCWYLRSGMFDMRGGGTAAVTDLYGVDVEDPGQRVLLHVVGSIVMWIYGHTNAVLDHPGRTAARRGLKREAAEHAAALRS